MQDDSTYKAQAAKRMGMMGVIEALIRSHPDPDALKAVWTEVSARLGGSDMTVSRQDDVGPDEQQSALLQKEIQRWTMHIHRTASG